MSLLHPNLHTVLQYRPDYLPFQSYTSRHSIPGTYRFQERIPPHKQGPELLPQQKRITKEFIYLLMKYHYRNENIVNYDRNRHQRTSGNNSNGG